MKYTLRVAPVLAIVLFLVTLVGINMLGNSREADAAIVGTVRLGVFEDVRDPLADSKVHILNGSGVFVDRDQSAIFDGRDGNERVTVVQVSDGDPYAAVLSATSTDIVTVCIQSDFDKLSLVPTSCSATAGEQSDPGSVTDKVVLFETGPNTTIFRGLVVFATSTDITTSDIYQRAGAAGSPAPLMQLGVVDGKDVTAFFDDLSPVFTTEDKLKIETNGPSLGALSPEHETVTSEVSLVVTGEGSDDVSTITEPSDDVISIFFLISDTQLNDTDIFDLNDEPLPLGNPLSPGVNTILGDPATNVSILPPDPGALVIEAGDGTAIGWEIGTTITVAAGGGQVFITLGAFDEAGNLSILDVDDAKPNVVFALYDVDTAAPLLNDASTGILFDPDVTSADGAERCTLNNDEWIQVIFDEDTKLVRATIEPSDFTVDDPPREVIEVRWFDERLDDPDKLTPPVGETCAGEFGTVFDTIYNHVYLRLDEALDPDSTPEVSLVDDIEDEAGNDTAIDTIADANDRIGPTFDLSDFDPEPIDSATILAGTDTEVSFTVQANEDLQGTKPDIVVANAFNVTQQLSMSIKSAGTNRWNVTLDSVIDSAIYNIHVEGSDTPGNTGSAGIKNTGITTGPLAGSNVVSGFFDNELTAETEADLVDIDDDAIFFEGDEDLFPPSTIPADGATDVTLRDPFFITLDFGTSADPAKPEEAEDNEYPEDTHGDVTITVAELDGNDVLSSASTADGTKWLIAISGLGLGDHELLLSAEDEAGNADVDEFELQFTTIARESFEVELSPGWNLVSFPGAPANASVSDVIDSSVPVTTVYSFDPTVPGGWLVAIRETSNSPWVGDLNNIAPNRGYWMLTDSFRTIQVDIPATAGGAAAGGTPVSPPTIPIFEGWNLIPILDVTGDLNAGDVIDSDVYLTGVEDIVSRIYTFNTIENAWRVIVRGGTKQTGTQDELLNAGGDGIPGTTDDGANFLFANQRLTVGGAYWIFASDDGVVIP